MPWSTRSFLPSRLTVMTRQGFRRVSISARCAAASVAGKALAAAQKEVHTGAMRGARQLVSSAGQAAPMSSLFQPGRSFQSARS